MQLPEIALCPVLWRLSILEKRHCPLTTQAIKKPPPPFIIISAHTLHCQSLSAPACQAEQLCRTQPAVHRYHLSHFTSRNFPDPLERLQESPISYYWSHPDDKNNNNNKKIHPTAPEEISTEFTVAQKTHSCEWEWVISQQELGPIRLHHTPFLFWDTKKELVICTWGCAFLTHVRTSNLFLPTDRQTMPYSLLPYKAYTLENEAFCFQALPCGQDLPTLGCISSPQAVQCSRDTNYFILLL